MTRYSSLNYVDCFLCAGHGRYVLSGAVCDSCEGAGFLPRIPCLSCAGYGAYLVERTHALYQSPQLAECVACSATGNQPQ